MDLYLKFDSEDDANAALFDGDLPKYRNIDVIGTIYKPTGDTLVASDGTDYPALEAQPGWHVNVRLLDGEDAAPLEPFAVEVATPVRVWA